MALRVYQNALPPENLRLHISSGNSGLDMTTITSASIDVLPPGLAARSWDAALTTLSKNAVVATHTFREGETAVLGDYALVVRLAVAQGIVRTIPTTMTVVSPFTV